MPGGNPVTALPGDTPRFPAITGGPVLVTMDPPKTAKELAAPSGTFAWAKQQVARSSSMLRIFKSGTLDVRPRGAAHVVANEES